MIDPNDPKKPGELPSDEVLGERRVDPVEPRGEEVYDDEGENDVDGGDGVDDGEEFEEEEDDE